MAQAGYKKDYRITKKQSTGWLTPLEYLAPRVKLLQKLTKKSARRRLNRLGSHCEEAEGRRGNLKL